MRRMNDYAVSYDTGRELSLAATIRNARIRRQSYYHGARVLFFDAIEGGRITRHYHLEYEGGIYGRNAY